jgi:pimeloyl-ACP methyl ester carboxylesterase
VLFLVHGSSTSARTRFDLQVPGAGEYSMMNVFAQDGFDVWKMDHQDYGKSDRTEGNSDIASGVEDLKAVVAVIAKETGQKRFHFLGEASDTLRAAAYAMAAPNMPGDWCLPRTPTPARDRRRWQSGRRGWSISKPITAACATKQ